MRHTTPTPPAQHTTSLYAAAAAAAGDNADFVEGGDGSLPPPPKLPSDMDIDQLLSELAGMDPGRRSGDARDEGRVEEEGWEGGEGGGGFVDTDKDFSQFEDGGEEEEGWKRKKKRKRRRRWDQEVRYNNKQLQSIVS